MPRRQIAADGGGEVVEGRDPVDGGTDGGRADAVEEHVGRGTGDPVWPNRWDTVEQACRGGGDRVTGGVPSVARTHSGGIIGRMNAVPTVTLGRPNSAHAVILGRPDTVPTVTLGRPNSAHAVILGRPDAVPTVTLGRPNSAHAVILGRPDTVPTVTLGRPNSAHAVILGRPDTVPTVTLGRPNSAHAVILGRPDTVPTVTLGRPNSARAVILGRPDTVPTVTLGRPNSAGAVMIGRPNTVPTVILGLDPTIFSTRQGHQTSDKVPERADPWVEPEDDLGPPPRDDVGPPPEDGVQGCRDPRGRHDARPSLPSPPPEILRPGVAHGTGLRFFTCAMNVRAAGAGRSRCRVQPPAKGILAIQPPWANSRIVVTARPVARR